MLLVLRIILTALWLIFTNLVLTDFQPGGRYLILLEAITVGSIAYLIRRFICQGLDYRVRSWLSAGGIIFGLGLIRLIFGGVRLSFAGGLIAYLGLVLMEMLLPGDCRAAPRRNGFRRRKRSREPEKHLSDKLK